MKNVTWYFILFLLLAPTFGWAQDEEKPAVPGKMQPGDIPDAPAGKMEVATFAGGCFWCTEAYFERLKGVQRVISGYCGGKEKNPTYQQVSNGQTGHAESVQIYFDPEQISYLDLLKVHFATHDPTTLNRQGPDVGEQYRSVVFYHNAQQREQAAKYMEDLSKSGRFKSKIVTQLVPYKQFYAAEKYHQYYYELHPNDTYVQNVARPKVKKFETEFKGLLKKNGKNKA